MFRILNKSTTLFEEMAILKKRLFDERFRYVYLSHFLSLMNVLKKRSSKKHTQLS